MINYLNTRTSNPFIHINKIKDHRLHSLRPTRKFHSHRSSCTTSQSPKASLACTPLAKIIPPSLSSPHTRTHTHSQHQSSIFHFSADQLHEELSLLSTYLSPCARRIRAFALARFFFTWIIPMLRESGRWESNFCAHIERAVMDRQGQTYTRGRWAIFCLYTCRAHAGISRAS